MPASCAYLLPLRRKQFNPKEARQIAEYIKRLGAWGCQVLVVDGSPAPVFQQHHALWEPHCRHVPVDRRFGYPNDKVNGVHTGIELTDCQKIVLADDDIRYSENEILQIAQLLERFDLVRPQNYLFPLPWWGRCEAARMLINRATLRTADYPGTCAFRRSAMQRVGHYDGDVLFDNEELIRHFASRGAGIAYANNLFVRKLPPSFRKWIEQRPRQAYEDFGLRAKTLFFASLLPLGLAALFLFGSRSTLIAGGVVALLAVILAIFGRARGEAARFFPFSVTLFAPLWIFERALSTYAAFYWYLVYRGYPFGERVLSKGIGRDWRAGGRLASLKLREGQTL